MTHRRVQSYMVNIPPPPPRSAFAWIPDVPILDWGEPETVEEALPISAQDETAGWWFENEGQSAFVSHGAEVDTLRQARHRLREREQQARAERIRRETLEWKGDWSMMGRCVELTPQVRLNSPRYFKFL
jgi:hypothetical protein